jgi:hypothetical protein
MAGSGPSERLIERYGEACVLSLSEALDSLL